MQKLNLEFSASQVLKAASLNTITGKVDEIVTEVNKLPSLEARIAENALKIAAVADVTQAEFDEQFAEGILDPNMTYYIYEE